MKELILFAAAVLAPVCGDAEVPAVPAVARAPRYAVEGVVYNNDTGEPLPRATIQVAIVGISTPANDDGRFRLILTPGDYQFTVSHVGFYHEQLAVPVTDSSLHLEVRLRPAMIYLGEQKVFSRAYDPAQQIIAQAIARKKDILSRIKDYSFDGYAKLVVRDASKPDSESIILITETQSTAYWERPDKFKEVITARKQSANLKAEGNLVTVGEPLNFNRNRIELGRYEVVSPTATDAMDHYNYYLLDTVYIDQRAVFVLEVEPKDEYEPLFAGQIQIADSTFDVVRVDVGFSKGIQIPFITEARYCQQLVPVSGDYWLPVQVSFRATAAINFPGIPPKLKFEHVASTYAYRVDTGHRKGTFDEYEIVVADSADRIDSSAWFASQIVPLTEGEKFGYARLDSLEHSPKPLGKKIAMGLAGAVYLLTIGQHDIFHFNRVEGAYLGLGVSRTDLIPNTTLRLKGGYGFEDEKWQYEFGLSYELWERRRLRIGVSVKDEVVPRPSVSTDAGYNPTFDALFWKMDPLDYYRKKGFEATVSARVARHAELRMTYEDSRQTSKTNQTDYSIFRQDAHFRTNPAILEGKLRAIKGALTYDSRNLIKNKGRDLIGDSPQYLRASVTGEYAAPDFIDNDFDYRRYAVRIEGRMRTVGSGMMTLTGYVGSSDGGLPPQRSFRVDCTDSYWYQPGGFNTLGEDIFGGNRLAVVYGEHDFGSQPFRMTGLGFLKKLPVALSVHGGAFWTEYRNQRRPLGDTQIGEAPKAYSEIGFGLSNLTSFLAPFNLASYFTWQLSDYDTNRFNWQVCIKL
jgi:hypothetical protein